MATTELAELDGRMLLHCSPAEVSVAAEVAAERAAGLVLTGRRGPALASQLRDHGFTQPILCDAERYSGHRRTGSATGVRPGWVRAQHAANDFALTDSGFIGTDDQAGLRFVLTRAADLEGPTIATLPLSAEWFGQADRTDILATEITRADLPVAITVIRSGYPFDTATSIQNLLELLRISVPILLLRTNIAGLGVLANGATACSVRPSRQALSDTAESPMFIPRLLTYRELAEVRTAVEATPDLANYWECACAECGGRSLAHPPPDRKSRLRHELHSMLDMHTRLFGDRLDRASAAKSWRAECGHALNLHEEIRHALPRWPRPLAIQAWREYGRNHDAAAHVPPQPGHGLRRAI